MSTGTIHFVTETGQSQNGVPGKKRLSKINAHVARFSHNRRKHKNIDNPATFSRTPSPLQVDFVIESPRTDGSRSSSDSPKDVTSHPAQLLDQEVESTNTFPIDLPNRRRSTGSPGSQRPPNNALTRHHSAPIDNSGSPSILNHQDETNATSLVRRHSSGDTHPIGPVPRIGSLGSAFQLGSSVGQYEKYLLDFYFTELQTKMFGFSKDATYCPYRIDGVRTIQKSPSALHWILIIAEQQMEKHVPEQSRSVTLSQSVLKRRANGYGVLRALLNNPDFDPEDAIVTLRYATSAECYVTHADACKEHLKALDSLLLRPGTLQYFVANRDKMALSLANIKRSYINAPVSIKSPSEFDTIRTMTFLNLRRLQLLSKQNHAEFIRHACSAYLNQHDETEISELGTGVFQLNPTAQESLLGRYINVKKTALFSTYAAEAMNSTCNPQSKFAFQAGLFALFYGLIMTLSSFGKQNLADKIMFLQRLKSVLDTSSARSLGPSAVLSVVDGVREQYYNECFSKEEVVLKEVDLCTYEINALKIFFLLDGDARIQLTTAVRAWLLSDISMDINLEKDDLKEEDLISLEEQVTTAWWRGHLMSKSSPSPSQSPEP